MYGYIEACLSPVTTSLNQISEGDFGETLYLSKGPANPSFTRVNGLSGEVRLTRSLSSTSVSVQIVRFFMDTYSSLFTHTRTADQIWAV